VIRHLVPCCQRVVMVCCLFYNFSQPFDFGCCSLAQEISFVDCYLSYSGSGLSPTCYWPSCLSSLCSLIVHNEISSFPLPFLPCSFRVPTPLCCVLVFGSLFIVKFCGFFFFFCGVVGFSAQGAMLVYPQG
jgi:hypothetical protein